MVKATGREALKKRAGAGSKPAKPDVKSAQPACDAAAAPDAAPAKGKPSRATKAGKESTAAAPAVPAAKPVQSPRQALAGLARAKAHHSRAAVTALATASPGPGEETPTPADLLATVTPAPALSASPMPEPSPRLLSPREALAGLVGRMQKPPARKGIRLFDLRENHCRWVLDERGREPLFCGQPRVGSCSWCAEHRRIVYPRAAEVPGEIAAMPAPQPRI